MGWVATGPSGRRKRSARKRSVEIAMELTSAHGVHGNWLLVDGRHVMSLLDGIEERGGISGVGGCGFEWAQAPFEGRGRVARQPEH